MSEHLKKDLRKTNSEQDTRLETLLQASNVSIQPSPDFERVFWAKVSEGIKEPWWKWALGDFEFSLPFPSLRQAVAFGLLAFMIGGTGGAVAATTFVSQSRLEARRQSVQYLSGFSGFKGLSDASVAAAYLKMAEDQSAL